MKTIENQNCSNCAKRKSNKTCKWSPGGCGDWDWCKAWKSNKPKDAK